MTFWVGLRDSGLQGLESKFWILKLSQSLVNLVIVNFSISISIAAGGDPPNRRVGLAFS